jgi:hypothetical protein
MGTHLVRDQGVGVLAALLCRHPFRMKVATQCNPISPLELMR